MAANGKKISLSWSNLGVHDILLRLVILRLTYRHLLAYPKGNNVDYLSLYLEVANYGSLPIGWRRHAKFCFTIVNQRLEKLSKRDDGKYFLLLLCLKEFLFPKQFQ